MDSESLKIISSLPLARYEGESSGYIVYYLFQNGDNFQTNN